jgi:hypothetical protein
MFVFICARNITRFTNDARTARAINVTKRSAFGKQFDGKLRILGVTKLDKWLIALRRRLKRRSDNDPKGGMFKTPLPIVNGCVDMNIVRGLPQETIPRINYSPVLTFMADVAISAVAIGMPCRKPRNTLSMSFHLVEAVPIGHPTYVQLAGHAIDISGLSLLTMPLRLDML